MRTYSRTTYFINSFLNIQNTWSTKKCLLPSSASCLRRGLTCRENCVVRRFPGPVGRVRLITSARRACGKPPIKLRFMVVKYIGRRHSHMWYTAYWLWVALCRRNSVTTLPSPRRSNKRNMLIKGVTFASSEPSHVCQPSLTRTCVSCFCLVGAQQQCIRSR